MLSKPSNGKISRRCDRGNRSAIAGARGFTLIEIMVVVAIIAILAAIGFPSYQDHVRKSRRAEAQQTLMALAARQQQFLLDTRAYAATLAALNVSVPPAVSAHYALSLEVGSGTVPAFTLTAAPSGDQIKEKCGPLSLTHSGVKAPATCW